MIGGDALCTTCLTVSPEHHAQQNLLIIAYVEYRSPNPPQSFSSSKK